MRYAANSIIIHKIKEYEMLEHGKTINAYTVVIKSEGKKALEKCRHK
jgi:hypothetical protein